MERYEIKVLDKIENTTAVGIADKTEKTPVVKDKIKSRRQTIRKKVTGNAKKCKVKKTPKKKNGKQNRKKTEELRRICEFPKLVLSTKHFLNIAQTKSLDVGYSVFEEFALKLVLMSSFGFVEMKISDWLVFMICKNECSEWFQSPKPDDSGRKILTTGNICVTKCFENNVALLEVSQQNSCRLNNIVLLSDEELQNCIRLNIPLQQDLTRLQFNPTLILEYYRMYIFWCFARQKRSLQDGDFFAPFGGDDCFDGQRLFREIPVIAAEKLEKDLALTYIVMDKI